MFIVSDNKLYSKYNLSTLCNIGYGCILQLDTSAPQRKGYFKYTYNWKCGFTNDCLQFAECLALGYFHDSEECVFKARDCNDNQNAHTIFGWDDRQNSMIAKSYAQNNFAQPNVGEAYAIVREKLSTKVALIPFHVAFVIFTTDINVITLEAYAGADLHEPVFNIYSREPVGNTFHNAFKAVLGRNARTIVLKQRQRV